MVDLLKLRKRIKKRKPDFIRQDAHKKPKLKKKWKRPKGLQSKMRLKFRGYRKSVSRGYSSPRKVAGLHPSGLKEVLIGSVAGLKKINPKTEGAVIGSTVGLKKRINIALSAKEKGIKILNIRDIDEYLKKVEECLKRKKKLKTKKLTDKEKKKEEKKVEKEKKIEEKLNEEEKKEKEKEEKDKVLTKRQS